MGEQYKSQAGNQFCKRVMAIPKMDSGKLSGHISIGYAIFDAFVENR